MQDPYSVLGVPREATAEEIRQAFRRLARDNHPDLHPERGDAVERFKAVNSAFQVLSDPKRRAEYDRFGTTGSSARPAAGGPGPGVGFAGLDDLFSDLFGGVGARSARHRPPPIRHVLDLTFEEAALGCTKQVDYQRNDHCERCGGQGTEPGALSSECGVCRGTGEIREAVSPLFAVGARVRPCPSCHGTGRATSEPCQGCRGLGLAARAHRLSVTIPAGIESGAAQEVAGAGNRAGPKRPRGDVELVIRVKPHAEFEREGDDVLAKHVVSFAKAAQGGVVRVKTLGGETELRVPAGTQHGDTITLRGAGVSHRFRRGKGDHRVSVSVRVPRATTDEQRRRIAELDKELQHSQAQGFLGRIRDWF